MKTYLTIFLGSLCGFLIGTFVIEFIKAVWSVIK